ncbi:MAG TPA: hypothetical protein VKW04_24280 [Planctomycetota bacterium]|nr:hypothetical protein [Planctomycetota bacterium]
MSVAPAGRPARSKTVLALLPWGLFAVVLLTLIRCDLNVNPILDEQQWLQSGLATAHAKFLKSGLVSGPLYGLILGVLFGAVYVGGAVVGVFSGTLDFVSWFLAHQSVFYFIARGLTAGIAAGGLALLARALAPRTGSLTASLLVLGFAFTAPAIDRIAYATPHGAMIGFSAALLYVLIRARETGSWIAWGAAGAIVAGATSAITIGLGLGLLAAWGAFFPGPAGAGPSRGRRLGLVGAGFIAGLVLLGYPILLHPDAYWQSNIRYQISRQILTDEGGRGRLLRDGLLESLPLWLAGGVGAWKGRFREGRSLAVGALLTAAGYVGFLGAVTRSAQISYSLAALPCLAYAASGLVELLRPLDPPKRALWMAALLVVPGLSAAGRVWQRVRDPHPRVTAAARVRATQAPGTTLLVDSWYGPRLLHPALLLAPYGKIGEAWGREPGFLESLERRLPRHDAAWTILPYPEHPAFPDRGALRRAGVDVVILSDLLRRRDPAWDLLVSDGTLQPIPPDEPGGIVFYRVLKSP